MSIIIEFKSDEILLEQSLKDSQKKIDEQAKDNKETLDNQTKQLVLSKAILQSQTTEITINIDQQKFKIEALKQAEKEVNAELDNHFRTVQGNYAFLDENIAKLLEFEMELKQDIAADSVDLDRLIAKAEALKELSVDLTTKTESTKKEVNLLKKQLGDATKTITAITGYLSLAEAVFNTQLDANLSAGLSLAFNTLQQIIILQTIAGAEGNLPLFFVLGTLAGSVAQGINQVKMIQVRAQQAQDAATRRLANRSIS